MEVEKIEGYIPKLLKLVILNCEVTRGFIFFYCPFAFPHCLLLPALPGLFHFFKKKCLFPPLFSLKAKSIPNQKKKKKTLPCLFWTQFASLIFVSHGPMILLLINTPFQLSNLSQPHFITLKLTYNRIFVCTQIGPFLPFPQQNPSLLYSFSSNIMKTVWKMVKDSMKTSYKQNLQQSLIFWISKKSLIF